MLLGRDRALWSTRWVHPMVQDIHTTKPTSDPPLMSPACSAPGGPGMVVDGTADKVLLLGRGPTVRMQSAQQLDQTLAHLRLLLVHAVQHRREAVLIVGQVEARGPHRVDAAEQGQDEQHGPAAGGPWQMETHPDVHALRHPGQSRPVPERLPHIPGEFARGWVHRKGEERAKGRSRWPDPRWGGLAALHTAVHGIEHVQVARADARHLVVHSGEDVTLQPLGGEVGPPHGDLRPMQDVAARGTGLVGAEDDAQAAQRVALGDAEGGVDPGQGWAGLAQP